MQLYDLLKQNADITKIHDKDMKSIFLFTR